MEYGRFRYDEPYGSYGRPVGRRINYFAWTVAILLLTGAAFAAWLASFYIFGQPERPDSYRILQKLHKLEPPKRFELTAAPAGEFLSAKQLYERYVSMEARELGPYDTFTSGMVALTSVVDPGTSLMETLYPADAPAPLLM